MNVAAATSEHGLARHRPGDIFTFPIRAARQAVAESEAARVAVATSIEQIDQLERPWKALELRTSRCTHAFQSFEWCRAWVDQFACEEAEPYVVTVRREGEIRLIWPLMRTRTGPLVALRWLSDPFCQYGDVLATGSGIDELVGIAWRWIMERSKADVVRLRHVRADALCQPFLAKHFHRDGEPGAAPFLDLKQYPSEASYEARYTKAQRRRRKRIRSELEEIGPLRFEIATRGQDFASTLERTLAAKRTWLTQRGLYSRPLASDRLGRFLNRLAEANSHLRLVTSVLSAGERAVAYEVGLRFKGRHYGFITAHDPELTDCSPARLHMDLSQRRAILDGLHTFDLMVPNDPHKASWSNGMVEVSDHHASLTARGRLYAAAYLRLLRPVIRRAYYAAPAVFRRQASRIACC